jgi:type VI secretion system protein ImpH
MADTAGQSQHPVGIERALETHFASYEFFAALRLLEGAHPEQPRLGCGARAADDFVRLGQVPSLMFAPSMFLEAERRSDGRLWLGGAFLGLFGPNGPLPLHLTEFAHDRRHNAHDRTFSDFADVFHHRLLCLFYRAWADAQPTVQLDRAGGDRFRTYVGALVGIGQPALQNRDAMPDAARLFHAGRLSAQVRNPEGLRVILEDFFRERVAIQEFRGEWLTLADEDRLHLGVPSKAAQLGQGGVLGGRVWGVQSRFRIVLGALSLEAFERFLPGTQALRQLQAIVRQFVGYEFDWDVQLRVARSEVPGMRLGERARLGWNSWLASPARKRDADDVVLKNVS